MKLRIAESGLVSDLESDQRHFRRVSEEERLGFRNGYRSKKKEKDKEEEEKEVGEAELSCAMQNRKREIAVGYIIVLM